MPLYLGRLSKKARQALEQKIDLRNEMKRREQVRNRKRKLRSRSSPRHVERQILKEFTLTIVPKLKL